MKLNTSQVYIDENFESAFTAQDIIDALAQARSLIAAGEQIIIRENEIESIIQIGNINGNPGQFLQTLRDLRESGAEVQISESQIKDLMSHKNEHVVATVILGFNLSDRLINMCVMNAFKAPMRHRMWMLMKNVDRLSDVQLEHILETLKIHELKVLFKMGKLPELSGLKMIEEDVREGTQSMATNWSSRYSAERDAVKLKGEVLGINKSNIFKEKPTCL